MSGKVSQSLGTDIEGRALSLSIANATFMETPLAIPLKIPALFLRSFGATAEN